MQELPDFVYEFRGVLVYRPKICSKCAEIINKEYERIFNERRDRNKRANIKPKIHKNILCDECKSRVNKKPKMVIDNKEIEINSFLEV